MRRIYNKINSLNLTDSKLANLLGMPVKEIPQWLLDLKRNTIKLKRDVKEKQYK